MKNIFKKTLILAVLGLSAFGNRQYEAESDATLTIDMLSYCNGRIQNNTCEYNGAFNVKVSCVGARLIATNPLGCDNKAGDLTITTSAPMAGIVAGSSFEYGRTDSEFKPVDSSDAYLNLSGKELTSIKIIGNSADEGEIYKVVIATGNPTFINQNLTSASGSLRLAYKGVLRNTSSFKNQIAKSHRGHLDRFTRALKDGVELLEQVDKKKELVHSVVHWRVQENSRLVVAFGSILDELLVDYDDVQNLQMSIKSMRTLVAQLRDAYGWNKSLTGQVSKASSTLLDVVRLELQELGAIKMAIGENVSTYTKLLKVSGDLKAKVDASKSGDMRAQRDIFTFVDLWNDQAWQSELNKLVNAGPDVKNLVTPKLVMLLQAMESLEDLSEAGFQLPESK